MAVNGIELAVGQKWRTRDGEEVEITKIQDPPDDHIPVYCSDGIWRTIDGLYAPNYDGKAHEDDLVFLVPSPIPVGELFVEQPIPVADVVSEKPVERREGVTLTAAGYERLAAVLKDAFDQAAFGKGKERHANGKPFDKQPMQDLIRLHGVGFATGQASKKSGEALGLPTVERQKAEILGAIVYLAGAIIAIEDQAKEAQQ